MIAMRRKETCILILTLFVTVATGFQTATKPVVARKGTRGPSVSKISHSISSSFQRDFLFAGTSTSLHASSSLNRKIEPTYDEVCDVLVLGSGPAARCISALLSKSSDVILADQNLDREWPANYGAWQDEWDTILSRYADLGVDLRGGRVGRSIDRAWDVTDCYFGGSFEIPTTQRLRLDRPYYRVCRFALQESLTFEGSGTEKYRLLRANHISKAIGLNMYSPAGSLLHDETGTTIQLKQKDGNILSVRSKLVVDCTGHETKLVMREAKDKPCLPPGFQIAYGAVVDVDETDVTDKSKVGPYDKEAMTLFDYRTDHYDKAGSDALKKVESAPTFMYAMPLKDNQIFFEETSLVARPAISFQECKDRCFQRLEYLGIKVTKIHEEEYCYIPMGGALPEKGQRVIALGGSAAMVHPSTGYHLCRCMMGAADVYEVVSNRLAKTEPNLDEIAASSYHALWTPDNIRQRNFAVFGGEFLMKQNVVGLRGFFDGFFRLPIEMWGGFLAGWPGLPNNENHETWNARLWFGLTFVSKLPFPVAADMLFSIISYIITEGVPLAQSVTPLLGKPESYQYRRNNDRVGDVAAKQEARRMIQEAKLSQDIPVDFTGSEAGEKLESSNSSVKVVVSSTEKTVEESTFQ